MNCYSFDVFDTCLCRLCGEPRLLFEVLSLKVQEAMGESCNEHIRQLFVSARVNAGGKDLREIYTQVASSFPIPHSVDWMAELEMKTEYDMLTPIVATRELVNRLRTKGKVLFISDMYLPSTFIKERLVEYGFFQEGDQLYVSEELQAWKHDGSLYKLVHDREGMAYRCWHHYGDNYRSDYKVPKKLGIHAHHIHYDYLPYEEQWQQMPVLQYQYPAILAGVARAVRLSSGAPDDQKAFVCDITAPLMVSWVLHMMKDAQTKGIKRLYFCARDVHTEFLIARQLQPLFPKVEARYLFISSESLKCEEDLLIPWFLEVGVLTDDKVALVDSNSSGKTLININALAAKLSRELVSGYYLMGWTPNEQLHPTLEDNNRMEYMAFPLYAKAVSTSSVKKTIDVRIVYELLFSVNYHKKTVSYWHNGERMRPMFNQDDVDSWNFAGQGNRKAKSDNDQLCLKFSKAMLKTSLSLYAEELFKNVSFPTLAAFIDRPLRQYLHYLHRFEWWGRPFVGKMRGKHRGVWKRGSRFYSWPIFVTAPMRFILGNPTLRRRMNEILFRIHK